MASQIKSTASQLFLQKLFQANSKDIMKMPHDWPFVLGILWWHVDSLHKGPVMQKVCFHIVTSSYQGLFLSLAQSKLRLCWANRRPGYWSNLSCDWLSTAWVYSEQETENGPSSHFEELGSEAHDLFTSCLLRRPSRHTSSSILQLRANPLFLPWLICLIWGLP